MYFNYVSPSGMKPMPSNHIQKWEDGRLVLYAVQHVPTGEFLRMSKFNPATQEPWTGPLEMSWIGTHAEETICQAVFLGDDWRAIRYLAG